jgi:hypothetical protein
MKVWMMYNCTKTCQGYLNGWANCYGRSCCEIVSKKIPKFVIVDEYQNLITEDSQDLEMQSTGEDSSHWKDYLNVKWDNIYVTVKATKEQIWK